MLILDLNSEMSEYRVEVGTWEQETRGPDPGGGED